jgi:hypothetical protein
MYLGSSSSWKEENKLQFDKLLKWVDSTEISSILAGTLNCSKPVNYRGINRNFTENCDLEAMGFEEPLYQAPECTYCPYNNLATQKNWGGLILDNLFVKKGTAKSGEVVLKDQIEIRTENNDTLVSYLSDHFGVRVFLNKGIQEADHPK